MEGQKNTHINLLEIKKYNTWNFFFKSKLSVKIHEAKLIELQEKNKIIHTYSQRFQ